MAMGGICAIIEGDGGRVEDSVLRAVLDAGTRSPVGGPIRTWRSSGVALAGRAAAFSTIGAMSGAGAMSIGGAVSAGGAMSGAGAMSIGGAVSAGGAMSGVGTVSGGGAGSAFDPDDLGPWAPLVVADARLDGRAALVAELRTGLDRLELGIGIGIGTRPGFGTGDATEQGHGPVPAFAPGVAQDLDELDEPDLIALAHAVWGDEAPARLIGDFAYVAWDERRHRLTCVRDGLGVRPLHVARTADGRAVVVASEARMVAAHPRVAVRLDAAAAYAHLCVRMPDDQRTILDGIRAVAPAHRLHVDLGGEPGRPSPSAHRYWSPAPSRDRWSDDPETSAARLRAALEAAVSDRLRGAGGAPFGLLLSGGLDSGSIAAIAGGMARERHRVRSLDTGGGGGEGGGGGGSERGRLPGGLVAYTYAFRSLAACDETGPAGRVAARHGLSLVELDVESEWLLQDAAAFRPDLDQPFVAWASVAQRLLRDMSDRGITTLLTGHGGDNVLAGSPLAYASLLRRGRIGFLPELRRDARARGVSSGLMLWSSAVRPLLPDAAARAARRLTGRGPAWRPPPWVLGGAGRVQGEGERGADEARARGAEPRVRDPAVRAAREQALVLGSVGRAIEGYARAAAAFGIDVRHPFLDRRVVEVALSIPPEHHYAGGRTKAVLRRAMRDDLPAEIVERPGKTDFRPYLDHSLREVSAAAVESLLDRPLLARAGLVDARSLAEAFDAYRAGRLPFAGNAMWSAITLELWLREHGDAIGLSNGMP